MQPQPTAKPPRKQLSELKIGIISGSIFVIFLALLAAVLNSSTFHASSTTANLSAANTSSHQSTQAKPTQQTTVTPAQPTTAGTLSNPPQQSVTATPTPAVKADSTTQPQATTQPTNCTNGTYVNSDGNTVCSPETSSTAPAGATAQCVDGTYSFSQHHSGTCSHHGGVAQWL